MSVLDPSTPLGDAPEGQDDFFLIANFFPEDTGLPFVVWISPKGNARHDARVKIAATEKATEFVASVALRPEPRIVAGALDAAAFARLCDWIVLNRQVLLDYWDGRIQRTKDALDRLTPLDG